MRRNFGQHGAYFGLVLATIKPKKTLHVDWFAVSTQLPISANDSRVGLVARR